MDANARTAGPTLDAGSLEEASAFLRAAGLVVDEVTASRVTGHLQLGPEHHTPWGIVHGGVYTTAIESAASIGASSAVRHSRPGRGRADQHHALPAIAHRRPGERRGGRAQPGPYPAALAGGHHRRIRQAHRPRRGPPAERRRRIASQWALPASRSVVAPTERIRSM